MSKRLLAIGIVAVVALAAASFTPGPTPPEGLQRELSLSGLSIKELTLADSQDLPTADQYDAQ